MSEPIKITLNKNLEDVSIEKIPQIIKYYLKHPAKEDRIKIKLKNYSLFYDLEDPIIYSSLKRTLKNAVKKEYLRESEIKIKKINNDLEADIILK